MDPTLFARYATASVPRYTSYPTAPLFSAAIGARDYRDWLGRLSTGAGISLYVHVPFCRAMCLYCGCHTTITARQAPIERYVAAIEREAELVASAIGGRLPVRHLHFGGGTPSLIGPTGLGRLMRQFEDRFDLGGDTEVAMEIDPRTFTAEMGAAMGREGFNRASIGVQTFDPNVQRAINRVQTFEETKAAVEYLRAAGVSRINFDLIYGLPLQSAAACLDTVRRSLELAPDRLAVFGYAHVPGFKPHQRRIDAAALPGASARLEQAGIIAGALRDAGYVAIGIDHFARPDDSMAEAQRAGTLRRNFQGYTTDPVDTLIGLGVSAIGRLPDGHVQNVLGISDYQRRLAAGELPVARGYRLSGEDRVRGAIIERIMCDRKVDIGAICSGFGWTPERVIDAALLDALAGDGLIERFGATIAVREEAAMLVRSVAAAFDAHLPTTAGRHSPAV